MTALPAQRTIEAEGSTWEEARSQVESQLPEGLSILSVQIISRGDGAIWFGRGETIDEAYANAQDKIEAYANAQDKIHGGEYVAGRRSVLQSPDRDVVAVEAFDEEGAREQVESQAAPDRVVKAIKLVAPGRSGLLGLGKTPGRYEVEVIRQATVEIYAAEKARISVTIGVPPELTQRDMEVLHDLLTIFSGRRGDSGLEQAYVGWWYKNQGIASELATKLGILSESGGRVLGRDQARTMEWLLAPACTLLMGAGSYSRDEIVNRMRFGCDVTHWSVDEMHVLGVGVLRGEVHFRECYQALGAALGR